jgi:hypothetical protein
MPALGRFEERQAAFDTSLVAVSLRNKMSNEQNSRRRVAGSPLGNLVGPRLEPAGESVLISEF